MPPSKDFLPLYLRMKKLLEPFAGKGLEARETPGREYALIGAPTPNSFGKDVWFGAVRQGKRYVSYHLMPVYVFPDLLENLSAELKKHMQGKSCFNFTREDETLFEELAGLTQKGYERFRAAGLIAD